MEVLTVGIPLEVTLGSYIEQRRSRMDWDRIVELWHEGNNEDNGFAVGRRNDEIHLLTPALHMPHLEYVGSCPRRGVALYLQPGLSGILLVMRGGAGPWAVRVDRQSLEGAS